MNIWSVTSAPFPKKSKKDSIPRRRGKRARSVRLIYMFIFPFMNDRHSLCNQILAETIKYKKSIANETLMTNQTKWSKITYASKDSDVTSSFICLSSIWESIKGCSLARHRLEWLKTQKVIICRSLTIMTKYNANYRRIY